MFIPVKRILVISDVHGSRERLFEVLSWADSIGAEETWCLGDTFGIGADGLWCWDALKEREALMLLGNHDACLVNIDKPEWLGPAAAALISEKVRIGKVGRHDVFDQVKHLLSATTLTLGKSEIALLHGSERDHRWGFIKGKAEVSLCFSRLDYRIIFCGHTHTPMLGIVDRASGELDVTTSRKRMREGIEFGDEGLRYLLNPGAVGGNGRGGDAGMLQIAADNTPLRFDWR